MEVKGPAQAKLGWGTFRSNRKGEAPALGTGTGDRAVETEVLQPAKNAGFRMTN